MTAAALTEGLIVVEGRHKLLAVTPAHLVEDDRELAWAEKHVRKDPDIKWILGNYVEADNANSNGHIFPLEELKTAVASIPNKPLNINHHPQRIVGSYVAAELLYPKGSAGAGAGAHAVVEALSGFWRNYFPEEYLAVQSAHAEGSLFYSMETLPEEVSCPGCGHKAAYEGRESNAYCAHMNEPAGAKRLHRPHFTAGALILPPVRPGWNRADVKELSEHIADLDRTSESVYAQAAVAAPHLGPAEWEALMAQIVEWQLVEDERETARTFPADVRDKLAKKGHALPDGSFPIVDKDSLRRAIRLAGNAKDPAAAKAHIIKRAKALGLTSMIPEGWK